MKMTIKQIEEVNDLLVDHSEALTAFFDEGLRYGMIKGCILGAIGGAIGSMATMGLCYWKSHKKKTKLEKES